MLAVRTIATALLVTCGGLASRAAAAPQTPEFHEIWRATPDAWIDFVHVETEQPELVVGIYSKRGQLTTWHERSGHLARTIQLESDQRFVLSVDRRLLAIVGYPFDCLKPDIVHGRTLLTELIFPKGLPPPPPAPPLPIPPRPPPPPPWTYQVHLSDSAELLVYTQAGLEDHMAAQVLVFGLDASGSRFVRVGSYLNQGQGEVQTTRVGRLIAQAEGPLVRILDARGTVRDSVPGGGGFSLAPSGKHLAVLGRRTVQVHELDATGRVAATRRIGVDSRPLDVVFAGGAALVRSRDHLTLLDLAAGSITWKVEATVGTYASAHVAALSTGELLIAAARREVEQAPARLDGAHVAGRARAHVDVLSQAGQPMLPTFTFSTVRWTRHAPQVLVLPEARRVLLHTGDVAYVSDPLP